MINELFNDIVSDEYGIWTQVCSKCAELHFNLGRLSAIGGDNIICGVYGCENISSYYLDLNS